MNLLDRSVGLLSLLILFMSSCEEPNEIGLSLNPDDKTGVYYAELPIKADMVFVDSINTSVSAMLLSGAQAYPELGKTEAIAYTQVAYNASALNTAAVLDSLVLLLDPVYFYGEDTARNQNFYVHRVASDQLTSDTLYHYSTEYIDIDPTVLGSASFVFGTADDTATVYREDLLNIKLDQTFAADLFEKIKAKSFDSTAVFYNYLKGLAIVGEENNQGIMGFDLSGGKSKLVMHYHTSTDTLEFNFNMSNSIPHYSYVKADYSGTNIPSTALYTEFQSNDGLIYGQAGTGLVPKLNFEAYHNFVDTVGDFILNNVEIDLGTITTARETLLPPSTLYMYLTDDTNLRKVFSSSQGLYYGSITLNRQSTTALGFNYFPYGQEYLAQTNGDPAAYFTMLKEGLQKLDEVLLYAATNSASVNHFIFNPEHAKLKLYYTKLKN